MELFQAFLTLAAACTVAGLRPTSGRQICRDAQGRIPRTASKDHYGRTVYCDVRGQNVGASLTDSYGKTIYRDAQGRDMGSALTDCYGRTTYYDACGRVIGSSTADRLGKAVCRDAQGRILGEGPKALPRLDHVPAPPRRVTSIWVLPLPYAFCRPFLRHAPGRRGYNGVCAMPAQYAISAH